MNWRVDWYGKGTPSVIIHVPHAGTDIPEDVRADLLADDAALANEINVMTDWRHRNEDAPRFEGRRGRPIPRGFASCLPGGGHSCSPASGGLRPD